MDDHIAGLLPDSDILERNEKYSEILCAHLVKYCGTVRTIFDSFLISMANLSQSQMPMWESALRCQHSLFRKKIDALFDSCFHYPPKVYIYAYVIALFMYEWIFILISCFRTFPWNTQNPQSISTK